MAIGNAGGGVKLDSLYYELSLKDDKFVEGLKRARAESDRAAKQLLAAELAADKAAEKLTKLEKSGNASAKSLDQARRATELTTRELAKARDASEQAASAIAKMETQAGRFAKGGGAAMLTAAGAIGAALLAVTVKAVKMAAEVDAAVRRIQNVVPGAAGEFRRLADTIESTTIASGRSREEIVRAAEAIAQNGVESVTDLANRLDVITRAADASGGSLEGIAGGLDQVLDLFGLTADQAERVAASLVGLAKGRAPIEDVFNTLAFAAPSLSRLGLDLDTASAALTTLINNGFKVRQAGSELAKYAELGDEGRAAIEKLAAASRTGKSALDEMNAAAENTRNSSERAAAQLREKFNAELSRMGTALLPLVNSGLAFLNGLLDVGDGKGRALADNLADVRTEVDGLAIATARLKASGDLGAILGKGFGVGLKQPGRDLDFQPKGVIGGGGGAGSGLGVESPEAIARRQEAAARSADEATRRAEKARTDALAAANAIRALASRLAVETAQLSGRVVGEYVAIVEEFKSQLRSLPDDAKEAGFAMLADIRDVQVEALAAKLSESLDTDGPDAAAFKTNARKLILEAFAVSPEAAQKIFDDLGAEIERRKQQVAAAQAADKAGDKAFDAFTAQAKAQADALRDSREQARVLGDIANGALRVADALGLASGETRSMLEGVISIAQSIGPLLNGLKQAKELSLSDVSNADAGTGSITATLGAALPVIGGIASVLGGLGGLFGDSPEEKARKEREEENTQAIEALTRSINDFSQITSTGRTFAAGRDSLSDPALIRQLVEGRAREGAVQLGKFLNGKDALNAEELSRFGLSVEEFGRLAKDAGIAVRDGLPTFDDVVAVGKALQAQEFNRFAESFAGQLDKLQRGFRLFGTTPSGQFADLVELLTNDTTGAPAIFDALKGIDVSTAEGAAQATQIIRDLFTNFENLDATDFGALDPSQFFAVLDQLFGLLGSDAVDAVGVALANLGEGFAVFDVTDPSAQARAFLTTLSEFSPAIAGLISDLDLGTAGGLEEARERLRQFYADVKDGTIDLGTEGGIAIGDLVDVIALLGVTVEETVATLRGVLGDLSQETDALGITNPLETLAYVFDRIGEVAPEIADALRDLDLTTVEGLREADRLLGNLFFSSQAGGLALAGEDVLAFQDLIRNAMAQVVSDTDAATREYERAMSEQQRASEEAARAANAAAEAAQRERYATADRAIAQLRNEGQLFDVTDPVQQLQRLAAVLKEGAPIFASILGNADLSSTEGRASGLEALRKFFLENPNGVESGFFSADQVLGQTLDLAQLLKDAGVSGDVTNSGTSGSFAVNQQITSVQGDRIFGAILSTNSILATIDARLASAGLGAPSLGSVLAPALADGAAGGGAGTFVFQAYLNGNTTGATVSAELQAAIEAIMQRIAREIFFGTQGA